MKKTLLIAAAALAAGVISSQAQAVYSQNIVGYVNTPIPAGFVNIANPLDAIDPGTGLVNNAITNSINVFSGNYDGSTILIWNGSGYNIFTIDSGQSTGIGNALDTAAVAPPIVSPGTFIYLNNTTGASITNTFVGTVHIDGTGASTNVVGVSTNGVATGTHFYASKIPVGGGLGSVLGLPVLSGNLDGSTVLVPNIVGGLVKGYVIYTVDSGQTPSGFGNALDTAEVPEPVIPVGTGFLINNTTGTATPWTQSF